MFLDGPEKNIHFFSIKRYEEIICGLFDYIRIHQKWFYDKIPSSSFMEECYRDGEYYISFQTKDLEPFQNAYETDENGILWSLNRNEWDENIETFLGKGGLKRIDIREKEKYSGIIEAYTSLWGSGKEGSGTWPSPIYNNLGSCSITLLMDDGIVIKVKDFVLTEPTLKTKAEQEEFKRLKKEKEEKRKNKFLKSPKEWEG